MKKTWGYNEQLTLRWAPNLGLRGLWDDRWKQWVSKRIWDPSNYPDRVEYNDAWRALERVKGFNANDATKIPSLTF